MLRVAGETGSDEVINWIRDIALDREEMRPLRDRAVRMLGERRPGELRGLFDRLDAVQLKERVLRLAGERADRETLRWIASVVSDEDQPVKLRDRALRVLADRAMASVELAALYDQLGGTELKRRAIRLLADRKDEAAVDKLIAIAENDPSYDLRRYAIRRLAETGHPKARAFLEDAVGTPDV